MQIVHALRSPNRLSGDFEHGRTLSENKMSKIQVYNKGSKLTATVLSSVTVVFEVVRTM